jgi:Ca-activated chloride channel homolog
MVRLSVSRHVTVCRLVWGCAWACVIAIAISASAQTSDDVHLAPRSDPRPATSSDLNLHGKPLRADVDLVLVPVTVTDPANRPVLTLRQDDFLLLENSVRQQIRYFSHEDGPISVALVLDCSASMKKKIEYEGQALSEFFNNANPADEYFAVTVSDKPQLIATSSDSIGTVQDRLAASPPHGHTALFDAIYMAISQLRTARYYRRALLIISDGGDNRSRYTRKEVKSLIEEADVLTYAIGIFDEEPIPLLKSLEERMGRDWLSELTDASGGRTIAADDRRKIPEIAAIISRELRSQYVLGYRPINSARDGKWRKIMVKVAPVSDAVRLQAHFREGYRAPSQ